MTKTSLADVIEVVDKYAENVSRCVGCKYDESNPHATNSICYSCKRFFDDKYTPEECENKK